MTDRYNLLLNSIRDTDMFIVQMFLFALLIAISYESLGWTPGFMIRPMRYAFLAFVLAAFILVTVYSGSL